MGRWGSALSPTSAAQQPAYEKVSHRRSRMVNSNGEWLSPCCLRGRWGWALSPTVVAQQPACVQGGKSDVNSASDRLRRVPEFPAMHAASC
jgi:hypothetical protein